MKLREYMETLETNDEVKVPKFDKLICGMLRVKMYASEYDELRRWSNGQHEIAVAAIDKFGVDRLIRKIDEADAL